MIISGKYMDGTLAINVTGEMDVERVLVRGDNMQDGTMYYPNVLDEWCTDCKEYDEEQHCCHRFTKVIRMTVDEMRVVRCKDCKHKHLDNLTWTCPFGVPGGPEFFCWYGEDMTGGMG